MHPRTTTRFLAASATAALLVLGTAACGDDDDTGAATEEAADRSSTTVEGPTTTAADAGSGAADQMATDATVVAQDFAFQVPEAVTAGARVTFDNQDGAPHTMTADEGDAFDSGSVDGGSTGEVTAPSEPGAYAFHCEIHPNMKATLTVE